MQGITISGVGKSEYQTLGSVETVMYFHGMQMLPSTVVEDSSIDFPILMGSDFFVRNHLNLNVRKKKLICMDSSSDARWILYLDKPTYHCHFVYYKVPCVARENLRLDEDVAMKVPAKWKFPGNNLSVFRCPDCAIENVSFFYDVLDNTLITKVQGVPGCMGLMELESFVLLKKLNSQKEYIKEG